ncbi:hypothetical protein V1318_03225 [Lysobacter sp. CCNWLW3]|uniref:DUF4189 domain-containing protein n=1 Tax=unclassified Lysobacter TaxID=2635362 RepID=UPI002FD11DD5
MAIDYARGKLGTAADMSNARLAEKAVVAQCRGNGGDSDDCWRNLLSWGNGCGVVAWGESYVSLRSEGTRELAASGVMNSQHSAGCQVIRELQLLVIDSMIRYVLVLGLTLSGWGRAGQACLLR